MQYSTHFTPEHQAPRDPVRIEVVTENTVGGSYKIILLDADDSFDVIVEDPGTGDRECVWSVIKLPDV